MALNSAVQLISLPSSDKEHLRIGISNGIMCQFLPTPMGPPTFLRDAFLGSFFLSENVNLMYFVRDVVIESLVVIHYRVVKP